MAKKKSIRKTIRIEGKLISARFSNRDDANDWYSKMLAQKRRAKAGLEVEFEPIEFERICADFICSRQKNETWKHDKYRLEHYFFPLFFGRTIHSITRKEWKAALDGLFDHASDCPSCKKPLKPKTVNNIRTMLSTLYDFAIQDEPRRAQFNPIKEIKAYPVNHEEIQFFHTSDECTRYLSHAQTVHPMYGMFAYIAINTGMREGEIISLRWECLNLDSGTIRIQRTWSHSTRKIVKRTKGKRERVIGINQSLLDAFKRHRAWSPFKQNHELIVCDSKGNPYDSKHLWEMHSKVIGRADLAYLTIHCLRHTYATQYLANGGSIWDLKNILGHQSIKTTERYAHALPVRIQAKSNVFEVNSDATVMPIKNKESANG